MLPHPLKWRVEKVIKGEIMSQIFCSKKICTGSKAEKVHPKHLCSWTKELPLLFKAALLGLRVLMCSTHSTCVARTRSHASLQWTGTQDSGYCRTSRYLNKAELIFTRAEPLWPQQAGSMDGTRKLDLPYCWITDVTPCWSLGETTHLSSCQY